MGFTYDQCSAALAANAGDEIAALNSLLDGGSSSAAAPGPSAGSGNRSGGAPNGGAGAEAKKPAGLFGMKWGKK